MNNRFKVASILVAAGALPILLNGCSSSADNPLCCNEFKVGAEISADIGGSAQSQVAVQALADVGGIAAGMIEDLTAACRGMASDLDATADEKAGAENGKDAKERMNAWCNLAVGKIKAAVGANAKFSLTYDAPKCEASVSASANCNAKCSVDGKCDVKGKLPTCSGGKLTVECKGDCTAEAGASVSCEGTCGAHCEGSCKAEGGIECAGKCDGTCEAKAGATGSQFDAQGNCTGICKGTCSATPPSVTCSGTCSGKCAGTCKGSASASVKCDGTCKGDVEPISCSGGETPKLDCNVDAKCSANCDASVSAKASCTPPAVKVDISGGANAEAVGKVVATLKANLPLVINIKTKLVGVGKASAAFATNIKAVTDIKAACILPVAQAVGTAVDNIDASVSATASIGGAVGIK